MSSRKKIRERIRKKESEIVELEAQIREGKAYIQALNDALKLLPREQDDSAPEGAVELRRGSMVADARDAIERAGKPLHISELLRALGREPTKKNRSSLGGSLAAYVRRGEVFTRPRPNTFGLVGMDDASKESRETPPSDFGAIPAVDDDEIPF